MKVTSKRKRNPIAKHLRNPLWRKRVVASKVIYNRKKQKRIDA